MKITRCVSLMVLMISSGRLMGEGPDPRPAFVPSTPAAINVETSKAYEFFVSYISGDGYDKFFTGNDTSAKDAVNAIRARVEFHKKLRQKFGEDSIFDFNHSINNGSLYLFSIPKGIDISLVEVADNQDGYYIISYPNLGSWPMLKDGSFLIDLSNYLKLKKVDLIEHDKDQKISIQYFNKGIELLDKNDITIMALRKEMENVVPKNEKK